MIHLSFVEVLHSHAVHGGAQLPRSACLILEGREIKVCVWIRTSTLFRAAGRQHVIVMVTSLCARSNWVSLSSPSVRAMMTLAVRYADGQR